MAKEMSSDCSRFSLSYFRGILLSPPFSFSCHVTYIQDASFGVLVAPRHLGVSWSGLCLAPPSNLSRNRAFIVPVVVGCSREVCSCRQQVAPPPAPLPSSLLRVLWAREEVASVCALHSAGGTA